MGTRCQVKVVDENGEWAMLYHHWDGYPSNMMKVFCKARDLCVYDDKWKSADAGHAAVFLASADAGEFNVENTSRLHGDLDWFYVLNVGPSGWQLDVYEMRGSQKRPVAKGVPIYAGVSEEDAGRAGESIRELTRYNNYGPRIPVPGSEFAKYGKGRRKRGWEREPARHSLASRGVKTKRRR